MSQSSSFLDALKGKNVGRPPIWIMRQAGRYLPSYRDLRSKYSFLEMCHEPDLIAQVTLLPFQELDLDAAIIFSDILVIAEALGFKVEFHEGTGPQITPPITTIAQIENLPTPDIRSLLSYVARGIKQAKQQLNVPLIGFCGAPFTVASYLIEGGTSRDLKKTKQWMWKHPDSFHQLLEKITQCSIDYLLMQIEAGVQAIQIFDSWAHVHSPASFEAFSKPYLIKILAALKHTHIPTIVFSRGSFGFIDSLSSLAPSCLSVDWNGSLSGLRSSIPSSMALQGNLDPYVLYADIPTIQKQAGAILTSMQSDPAFIFNLGHGVLPDTPLDSVKALVETVKNREK